MFKISSSYYVSKYVLLINFMKDKKKKGCSQGQEGEQSDESDDEEAMIYFGFNNENKGKEQIIAITRPI